MILSNLSEPTTEAEADLVIADLEARILEAQEKLLALEERQAKVIGIPINPYLRVIESDDGEVAAMRVVKGHPSRPGWKVSVRPNLEGAGLWSLAGRYNRWGVRVV